MSAKTSSKKDMVAKVLGRRLSRALLRSRDSNTDDSPVSSRPQTAQPQPQPREDEGDHESPRSSSSYTVTSQRPVSVGSPDAKRLSRRVSLRQRIWSASPSNQFQDDDDEGEPGSAVVTSANRRSAYIPRHAASDFSKNARGNKKGARKQPSAARLAADEANDRISKRFSTFNTPRDDDERTLCSLNEEPRTAGARASISTATSPPNTGELDDLISTLHREQALHALNTATPGEKPAAAARNRQSGAFYSWTVGQPPELDAAADSDDDSSDDDEYGVYLDHGESRRRSRQADKLWVEVDAAKRQNRAPSFDGLNTSRSSVYSNRTSAQYSLQPSRNSMLSTSSSSTYSTRNSVYSTSPATAPDMQDAGCGEDPVLHRNSTYLDEKSLPIPEPLATKRSSGPRNPNLSVFISPPVLDDVRTKSPRRRPATARTPTVATVMEL